MTPHVFTDRRHAGEVLGSRISDLFRAHPELTDPLVDHLVCLQTPPFFSAGAYYDAFTQQDSTN